MVFCLLTIEVTDANTLLIERLNAQPDLELPIKSQSMDHVRLRFGNPIKQFEPVGDPPIVRWEYQDFIVYFEYDHVITAVLRQPQTTQLDRH